MPAAVERSRSASICADQPPLGTSHLPLRSARRAGLASLLMEPTTDTLDITAETTTLSTDTAPTNSVPLVEEELLVEEISIDGMCGVY